MSSIKKQQHHVFERYLSAWAETGSFCCYSKENKNQFSTTPEKVGKKRFFYQLNRLTVEDLQFIDLMIGRMDKQLRQLHSDFVRLTQLPFKLEDSLNDPDLPPNQRQELERELREAKANLLENYHFQMEVNAIPLLSALKQYDDSFYADIDQYIDFVSYLFHQYFRTENLRRKMSALPSMFQGHSFERTAFLVNHIFATSAGASIYQQRDVYKIIFLKNATEIPLITGDQPVLNLLDPAYTDDVELYYPICPETAILLTSDENKKTKKITELSDTEVESYNFLIFNRAANQVYSSDPEYLDSFVQTAILQL